MLPHPHTSRLIASAPPIIHAFMAPRITRRLTTPMDPPGMHANGTIAGDNGQLRLYRELADANLVTSILPAIISCSADLAAASALGGIFVSRAGL